MEKLIATIRKNSVDEIRVALTEFMGYTYLDVGLFTDLDGKLELTKEGITIRPALLSELRRRYRRPRTKRRERGW